MKFFAYFSHLLLKLHQSNTIGAKDQDNDCSTFAYNPASGYQFYPGTSGQYTGPENYSATDGSGTLAQYCSQKDCCSGATSWVGQEDRKSVV